MSTSCCKREPTERALFNGDDAHAAVTRMVRACEHGRRTCVECNVGWLQAWLIDRCSNKDARKSESKDPDPFVQQRGRAKTRKKERTREREKRDNQRTVRNVAFYFAFRSRPPNSLDILYGLTLFFSVWLLWSVRAFIVFKVKLCIGMVLEMVPFMPGRFLKQNYKT